MGSFGVKARKARLAAGLSQDEVADRAGVPRVSLSRWEAGTVRPSRSSAAKVAQALGIKQSGAPPKEAPKAERVRAKKPKTSEDVRYVQSLAYYRAKKKLTIQELAKASGVSDSVISGIEQGKLPCVAPWVSPLAQALGIKPGDIYNNVPGSCEYIGEGLKDLERKYPAPEKTVDYWGGTTMVVEMTASRPCGWCGKGHEGLGCG